MANKFVFADEAGCFTFKRKQGASRYFLLCTLVTDDCSISHELLDIRRKLIIENGDEIDKLHATTDKQATRDAVFGCLANHDFRIDATILEKSKAQPQTRTADHVFYQYACYYHFRHIAPKLIVNCDKLLVTAAALGQKKTKASFKASVNNSLQQLIQRDKWEVSFIDAAKDPMLWAVDYCAWAIQRKWEMGNGKWEMNDTRSYSLIANKIITEFDLWQTGSMHFY